MPTMGGSIRVLSDNLKELDELAKQAYHLSETGNLDAFARSEQLAAMIDVTLTEFDNEKNG